MALMGIYAAPDRDIEISERSSLADLDEAKGYAMQHIKASGYENWRIGIDMLNLIAELRKEKPLMFKSVRAA